MGVIVQQKEQYIKKFRQLRTLATFHQFWAANLCDSQHQLYMQFQWEIFNFNC